MIGKLNLDAEYTILKKLKEDAGIIDLPENPTNDDLFLTILSTKYFLRDIHPPLRQVWDQLVKIKKIKENNSQ